MKGPGLVRAFFYLWASIVIYPVGSKAVEYVNDTFTLCDFPGIALTSLTFTILTTNPIPGNGNIPFEQKC